MVTNAWMFTKHRHYVVWVRARVYARFVSKSTQCGSRRQHTMWGWQIAVISITQQIKGGGLIQHAGVDDREGDDDWFV